MKYLSIDSAKEVVELLDKKSEFIPGSGARCPLCGSWGNYNNNTKKRKNIYRRYYICPMCGYRFVALETIS